MSLQAGAPPDPTTGATGLVPPRPNLGPEPWRDENAPTSPLAWIATATVAALLVAWIMRRRRRGAGSIATASSAEVDDSPEGRLVALGDRLRAVLASRLGPSLRARTTEEIAGDPRLAERLDGEDLDRLVAILGAGDRVKFARRGVAEGLLERLPEWTAWAGSLDGRLASTPGSGGKRQPPSP
ncbi:hypothetical protein [Planctomyces sp. SH-PL62]|uniref:hypothetical protein n=1 Tax=Planctomyces sp. SH-PL62 TaxID=1636152 RepID=UPI00078C3D9C|nr:hypothetical protein [Planctomyces sp. SH-PL62]AMV39945.1 hypothetical protein VT85_21105 [Planctomyces sp. SH-PL62]